MCVRVDNYYRIKEQIRRCINHRASGHDFFCSLCFEPSCDHNLELDSYEDALSQLNWWADIAWREAVGDASGVDTAGLLVPPWPLPAVRPQPKPLEGVSYIYKVALDMDLYGVVNNGDKTTIVNEEGEEVDSPSIDIDQDGVTWGYITDTGFYPLATFSGGWSVEDFGPFSGKEDAIGYWMIPVVSSHCQFSSMLGLVGMEHGHRN